MKKIIVLLVFVNSFFACAQESRFAGISGISIENFPKMDGSTSTEPLMKLIAYKLLGYKYNFFEGMGFGSIYSEDCPEELYQLVTSSQTHNSIINLIDGTADVVFSARQMSPDEKQYAIEKGIVLIETPIALDAFVFMVNKQNPVNSLTHEQIIRIYTGQYTVWNEAGGNGNDIHPYMRNKNSGSQELMENIVMQNTAIAKFDVDYEPSILGMMPVYYRIKSDENSICYIVYYFHEKMIPDNRKQDVKLIAVNGIMPNHQTVTSGEYPYIAPVFAMINRDLDKKSMAYKLYEWLQTEEGKKVIAESGYIPN